MEFKLNRIDTDIRNKFNEERKDTKVHSGKNIEIKKDIAHDQEKDNNKKSKNPNHGLKKIIIVDGIKENGKKINIDAEKVENIGEVNSKGIFLDKKK